MHNIPTVSGHLHPSNGITSTSTLATDAIARVSLAAARLDAEAPPRISSFTGHLVHNAPSARSEGVGSPQQASPSPPPFVMCTTCPWPRDTKEEAPTQGSRSSQHPNTSNKCTRRHKNISITHHYTPKMHKPSHVNTRTDRATIPTKIRGTPEIGRVRRDFGSG